MKALLPIALLLLAAPAVAQGASEKEHLELMREAYGFASWTQGAPRAGVDLRAFEPTGFEGGAVRFGDGRVERPFTRPDGTPAFLVELFVMDRVADAHEQVLRWVASSTSPELVPRARERHLALGDVGFLAASGAGPQRLAWATFVRGNVAVRVLDTTRGAANGPDLRNVASALDQRIGASAELAPGAELAKPVVTRLAVDGDALAAGDVVRLDFQVTDSGDGTPTLAWSLGGAGLGYVERDAGGDWMLHTTGPGALVVELDVLGSNGTMTRRTLPITVGAER
jgi:hypothetical protein